MSETRRRPGGAEAVLIAAGPRPPPEPRLQESGYAGWSGLGAGRTELLKVPRLGGADQAGHQRRRKEG